MATNRWAPKQLSTLQTDTIVVTGYDVATTYKATIGNKTYSTLGVGGSTATTAAALEALLAASSEPEFLEVTFSINSSTITIVSNLAGRPFTISASVSGGAGTISHTVVTANTSPNDVNDPLNWSAGHVPAAAEDVYIDNTDISLLYNLTALAGTTLTSLNISMSFTGNIGLPEQNNDNTEYTEYRPLYWQMPATTINIGQNPGSGSGRIKLDTLAVQTLLNIYNTGGAISSDKPAVMWLGTHASNVVNLVNANASFGAAVGAGTEVATIATLRQAGGTLRTGTGVTLTTVNMESGDTILQSAITTLTQLAGTLALAGSGAITTFNELGGACTCQSTGTIGTLIIGTGASFDLSTDIRPITLSTVKMHGGSSLTDTAYRGVYSSGIQLINCFIGDVSINLGSNRTLTPS